MVKRAEGMKERFITLTWDFIRDPNTTMQEKLILAEISQLCSLDKGCIASNSHFAALLGVKKEAISRSLKSLINKGFIVSNIKPGTRNHHRTITINKMLLTDNKMLLADNKMLSTDNKMLIDYSNNTVNKTINKTEREGAHNFLKNNASERLNVWEMQNQKQIDNYPKFILDFNDTVTIEKLNFDCNILFSRLNKYARNWIANSQNKKVFKLNTELPTTHPSRRKLKYN